MTKSIALPSSGSRWRRFIDKLAGGPPNLEKLDKLMGKRWFMRYNVTLYGVFLCLVLLDIPELVDRINGVPASTDLQTAQVRIIRTHLTEPHLFVEFPDGRQRGMEWPVPISADRKGYRSYAWTDEQRERLPGCLATVRGIPLRWTINDRFRVWELDCPVEDIEIGLDKTVRSYMTPLDFEIFLFIFYSGFHFFVFVIYRREKRGNL